MGLVKKDRLLATFRVTPSQYGHYQEDGWIGKGKNIGGVWYVPAENAQRLSVIQAVPQPRSSDWHRRVSLDLSMRFKLFKPDAVREALSLTLDRLEQSLEGEKYRALDAPALKKSLVARIIVQTQRHPDAYVFHDPASQEARFLLRQAFNLMLGKQEEDAPDIALPALRAAVKESHDQDVLAAQAIILKAHSMPAVRKVLIHRLHQMEIDAERLKTALLVGHAGCSHTLLQALVPIGMLTLLRFKLDGQAYQRGQRYISQLWEDAGYQHLAQPSARSHLPDWQR